MNSCWGKPNTEMRTGGMKAAREGQLDIVREDGTETDK